MTKRKGAGSAQSSSLLDFFSTTSTRLSATPCRSIKQSAVPKGTLTPSIAPGSSWDTAVVIDDSSDEEVWDVNPADASRPLKRVRLSGHIDMSSKLSDDKSMTLPPVVKPEPTSLDLADEYWIDEDDEAVGFDNDDALDEGDSQLDMDVSEEGDGTSFSCPVCSIQFFDCEEVGSIPRHVSSGSQWAVSVFRTSISTLTHVLISAPNPKASSQNQLLLPKDSPLCFLQN